MILYDFRVNRPVTKPDPFSLVPPRRPNGSNGIYFKSIHTLLVSTLRGLLEGESAKLSIYAF